MQRRGGRPGRVRKPLGRTPGGRRERHHRALLAQDGHDAAHDGGLADARPAGDHRDLGGERGGHRLGLLPRQRDARLALVPGQRARLVDVQLGRRRGEQLAQARRQRGLGAIEARLVHGRRARVIDDGRVDGEVAGPGQAVDRRVDLLVRQIEQRRRPLHQARPRHEHVSVAGLLVERVAHPGLSARGRVARDAQRRRQLVRRQESDPPHVEGEAVRVLAHARDGRRPVPLVNARREGGRDAVALQEHHHLAHLALRAPGRADGARPRRPDPRHLADAAGVAVQDLQGLDPEALHDARGELRSDPLDQPRPEVTSHPLDGLGRDLGIACHPELIAEARGGLEPSRHPQHRAGRDAHQASHDGDDVAAAFQLQARDGERAVAAGIDDPFHGPFEGRLRIVGRALAALARRARSIEQIHAGQSTRGCGIISGRSRAEGLEGRLI